MTYVHDIASVTPAQPGLAAVYKTTEGREFEVPVVAWLLAEPAASLVRHAYAGTLDPDTGRLCVASASSNFVEVRPAAAGCPVVSALPAAPGTVVDLTYDDDPGDDETWQVIGWAVRADGTTHPLAFNPHRQEVEPIDAEEWEKADTKVTVRFSREAAAAPHPETAGSDVSRDSRDSQPQVNGGTDREPVREDAGNPTLAELADDSHPIGDVSARQQPAASLASVASHSSGPPRDEQ